MSFNWINYVYIAEGLQPKTEEAYIRCSISRAYYGVFCPARNIKGLKNYLKTKEDWEPSIHIAVINAYRHSTYTNDKQIGVRLDTLRKLRVDADYNEDISLSKDFADRAVIKAKDILKRLGIPYSL